MSLLKQDGGCQLKKIHNRKVMNNRNTYMDIAILLKEEPKKVSESSPLNIKGTKKKSCSKIAKSDTKKTHMCAVCSHKKL